MAHLVYRIEDTDNVDMDYIEKSILICKGRYPDCEDIAYLLSRHTDYEYYIMKERQDDSMDFVCRYVDGKIEY